MVGREVCVCVCVCVGRGGVREGKREREGYATKAKGQRDSSGVKQIKRKETEPSPRALSDGVSEPLRCRTVHVTVRQTAE